MAPGPRLALPVLLGAIALAGCAAPPVAPEPSGEMRMFNGGRSCLVDAREVTVAQYRAYLLSMQVPESVVERARALWQAGKPEEAEKVLAEAVAASPADGDARLLLGEIRAWDGRPDEAVAAWTGALTGKPPDAPLLLAAGRLHLERAEDGPWRTRKRGNVEMKIEALTGGDPAVAEAFRKEHLSAAEALFRKAVAAAPANAAASSALAGLLVDTQRAGEAVPLYAALAKKEPKSAAHLVGWAAALRASGKKDDSKAKLDQALKLAPRSGDVHAGLFFWMQAHGTKDEAEAQRRRAGFFSWLPDFSKLEYSDALYARLEKLTTDPFSSAATPEEAEKKQAERRGILEALVAAKDGPSDDVLACVCWKHCCHGPLEDAAFAALGTRGKTWVPVLRRMLAEGGATCTKGGAARTLAAMKEPSAFEAVAALLVQDTDAAFPMDIAGALRIYGDPRAVPLLAAAMRADDPPLPPPAKKGRGRTVVIGGPPGSEDGLLDGTLWSRARAALALGEFEGPEARAALEKACANPDVGPFCHAVLWRLTGDEKAHGRFVAGAVRSEGLGPFLLGPYLARIDHPNAKMLHDEWKAKSDAAKKGAK